MATILSFDSSTSVISAAIHRDGQLLSSSDLHIPQSAATKLALLIEDVLKKSGVKEEELNAVCITSGPGSYTGLRIATSTAKGLCYALNIPLVAVSSLELLAYQVSQDTFENAWLCPMIDARRMEVYCALFDQSLKVKQSIEAKIIDEFSFLEILDAHKVLFFGDGAFKCKDTITHSNAYFIDNVVPQASMLGAIAQIKLEKNQLEDMVHFEPFYLKDFVAKKANINL